MKLNQRQDFIKNKETLNFLINTTEMLQSSNAILGRNDEFFCVDASKATYVLMRENANIDRLFLQSKLILDFERSFGIMSIVTGSIKINEIQFFNISESLLRSADSEDELYPFITEVRNWFLNIPKFSETDKDKYERIYQKNKAEISELMHKHADEILKAIFSPRFDMDDQNHI